MIINLRTGLAVVTLSNMTILELGHYSGEHVLHTVPHEVPPKFIVDMSNMTAHLTAQSKDFKLHWTTLAVDWAIICPQS
jgi:hypothetical protein